MKGSNLNEHLISVTVRTELGSVLRVPDLWKRRPSPDMGQSPSPAWQDRIYI